jgi:hypothetical protein
MVAAYLIVMMKKFNLVQSLVVASCLVLELPGYALTNSTPHVYPSGVQVALQIGSDLYDSLDAKYRNKLQAPAICAVPVDAPELAPVEKNDENKSLGQVFVSVGFVDLINHIAHAKAIDNIEPGYFEQYMSELARETASGTPPEAPSIVEDRYWTDDVMNEQASYFNQMMGMTMAINLSRHYLGQFNKYAGQMQPGKMIPINNFLTSAEWDTGVRAGAVNSLNCALGTEGAKALFDAIGKMAHRPAWTAYIVPQKTDINRLNKRLAKYEVDFFHGGLN